ncbi:Uncharacterised protein [Bordetella pertussis]|nr:Uncharacterised protein [Bordetella pertussis]
MGRRADGGGAQDAGKQAHGKTPETRQLTFGHRKVS